MQECAIRHNHLLCIRLPQRKNHTYWPERYKHVYDRRQTSVGTLRGRNARTPRHTKYRRMQLRNKHRYTLRHRRLHIRQLLSARMRSCTKGRMFLRDNGRQHTLQLLHTATRRRPKLHSTASRQTKRNSQSAAPQATTEACAHR